MVPPPHEGHRQMGDAACPNRPSTAPYSSLHSAHWLKSILQLPRMKSQARGCPTTLLAMLLMVAVASCFRILLGSRVYCRYLGGDTAG